jgi:hypothetical protein
MPASPAELVRTLLTAGRRGELYLAERNGPAPLQHTVLADGTPLLLVPDDAAAALRSPAPGADDVAVLVAVPDLPPYPDEAASRGEAVAVGWAAALPDQRAAADAFAAVRPLPELLDVGHGRSLYRVDLAELRLDRDDQVQVIDPDDFRCAAADPVYADEAALLADLNDHHPAARQALLQRIRPRLPDAVDVRPIRVDRHGLSLRVKLACAPVAGVPRPAAERRLRMDFTHPADSLDHLTTLIHHLCCPHCRLHRAPKEDS